MDSKSQKTREDFASDLSKHEHLGQVLGFANSTSVASVYAASTVVNPPDVTIRGRWGTTDAGFLGEQLLLNYRPETMNLALRMGVGRFYDRDAVMAIIHAEVEEDPTNAISLPAPKQVRAGLTSVIASRRSKRNFSGRPVTKRDLSTLIKHADGVSGHFSARPSPLEPEVSVSVRTAQSGGGLFPITLFVLAVNVRELRKGFYEYLPNSHSLRPVDLDIDEAEIAKLCSSPDYDVLDTCFSIIYVYSIHKNSTKYGNGGVVFGLIEVGGIAQNVHLIRTAMGLAGCCQGGFNKQGLEKALGLDGVSRHVVHFTAIAQEEN